MTRTHTASGEPLIAPQVNMNGTSRAELVSNYSNAQIALIRAIDAVRMTSPHGRDFQTCKEPGKTRDKAHGQHLERVVLLEAIAEEMDGLAHMVMEQVRA